MAWRLCCANNLIETGSLNINIQNQNFLRGLKHSHKEIVGKKLLSVDRHTAVEAKLSFVHHSWTDHSRVRRPRPRQDRRATDASRRDECRR